jgi:hypothetical protein
MGGCGLLVRAEVLELAGRLGEEGKTLSAIALLRNEVAELPGRIRFLPTIAQRGGECSTRLLGGDCRRQIDGSSGLFGPLAQCLQLKFGPFAAGQCLCLRAPLFRQLGGRRRARE